MTQTALRKAKALQLSGKVQKISDLGVYALCSVLGRQHGSLTEQSLMVIGGEAYEIQRRQLTQLKLSSDPDSLQVKVQLTKTLGLAEKRWRDRLLSILDKGSGWQTITKSMYWFVRSCILLCSWFCA